jgi:hypothetical protein
MRRPGRDRKLEVNFSVWVLTSEHPFYIMRMVHNRRVEGLERLIVRDERSKDTPGIRGPGPSPASLLPLLDRLAQAGLPRLTAVLGTCLDDRPVAIRLSAPVGSRLLVLGDDGAGKTALLRTLVLSVALTNPQRDVQFALLDPAGSLESLADLPHLLTPPVREPLAALDVLQFLIGARKDGPASPHIVVVADDLQRWWTVLAQAWIELADVGHGLGVHLIAAFAPPLHEGGLEFEWGAGLWLVGRLGRAADREAAGVVDLPLGDLDSGSFFALTARDETRFRAALVASRRAALLAEGLWDVPGPSLIRRPVPERRIRED